MRFFLPAPAWPENTDPAVLDPFESRHATSVMRVQPGEALEVFDGRGRVAAAVVLAATKKEVQLQLSPPRESPAPTARLALAVAVPKGSTIDWIIEKAVELGASEIVPLLTQRTVVRLDPDDRRSRETKWQRLAIEACKQCGQNWLPRVHPPLPLADALATLPPREFALPLVASLQPDAPPLATALHADGFTRPADAAIWIGPEGDFTPDEYSQLRASGLQPVSLGPIVLRVETAALYCLSVLRHHSSAPLPKAPRS